MSTLSDGLAAKDKATPGPWASAEEAPDWIGAERNGETFHVADVRGWGTLEKEGQKGCDELSANIVSIIAAPDALDWIAKALPWIKAYEKHLIMANLHGHNYDTAPLTALIAEAEGTEKEGGE